jgi:predicted HicB family RNase H-like nuclease
MPMTAKERQTTSIKVDPELWKRAKHVALDEGQSVGLLVERALREYVNQRRGK